MLINQVLKHIELFEYDNATFKLKALIERDESCVQAYILLLKIYKLQSNPKIKTTEKEFFNYVKLNKKHEEFYNYLESLKLDFDVKSISFEMKMFYLETLWKLGKIKKFQKFSETMNIFLLDNKMYSKYLEFTSFVEGKTKVQNFILIGKIIYFCETGNNIEFAGLIHQIKKDLFKKQKYEILKEQKFIKGITATLEMYKESCVEVYSNYIFFKLFECFLGLRKIDYRDVLEFILLSKKEIEQALLLEININEEIKEEITRRLKQTRSFSVVELPRGFINARKRLQANITMAQRGTIQEPKNSDDIGSYKLYKIKKEVKNIESSVGVEEYKLSELEKRTIKEMEYQINDFENLNSLAMSFIELDMYYVARMILEKMPESSNKCYLLAVVSKKINNYSEAIYIINNALDKYKLQDEEILPFLYIKATSFMSLNMMEDADRTFKIIKSINPSYRNVKEMYQY